MPSDANKYGTKKVVWIKGEMKWFLFHYIVLNVETFGVIAVADPVP